MKSVCKLGQMSYSGNSRANPNDQPIGFGASHSTPPISEMTHPYVPFDMSSVPVCSEFFVHGTVQRCLAEAGCIPQKGSYTTGTIPWQQRVPILDDLAKKQANLRVLIMIAKHGRNSGMDLGQLLAWLYNCSRSMLWPTGTD
uniref:Uncharacterized protein n=1 Tax=Arundo donax TaxID=35708 RepID=A0A0A9G8W5_ARUDO